MAAALIALVARLLVPQPVAGSAGEKAPSARRAKAKAAKFASVPETESDAGSNEARHAAILEALVAPVPGRYLSSVLLIHAMTQYFLRGLDASGRASADSKKSFQ